MTRATVLLTALLAGLSVGAVAQTGNNDTTTGGGNVGGGMGTQTQTFTELDGNNDGVLDEEEVSQGNVSGGNFQDIDTNGDNEVDRNEYYEFQRQNQ